jgi:hypothetical protein
MLDDATTELLGDATIALPDDGATSCGAAAAMELLETTATALLAAADIAELLGSVTGRELLEPIKDVKNEEIDETTPVQLPKLD